MFILSSSSVCFPVYILSCSAVGPLQMGTGGHPFCLRLLPITDKRRSPGRCSSFIRVLPITSPGSCPLLVRGLPIHVHIYIVQAFLLFSLCFNGHSEPVSYAHEPYWVPYEVQHRMYQLRKQKNCSQIIIYLRMISQ